MGQTAGQIEHNIENKRLDLTQNLQELENKVKSATDWRHQFGLRPMTFLGVAFGGGMVLAAITKRPSPRRYSAYAPWPSVVGGADARPILRTSREHSPATEGARRTWENVKGALIGVAAQRMKEYAEDFVPGFAHQYDKREAEYSSKPDINADSR